MTETEDVLSSYLRPSRRFQLSMRKSSVTDERKKGRMFAKKKTHSEVDVGIHAVATLHLSNLRSETTMGR